MVFLEGYSPIWNRAKRICNINVSKVSKIPTWSEKHFNFENKTRSSASWNLALRVSYKKAEAIQNRTIRSLTTISHLRNCCSSRNRNTYSFSGSCDAAWWQTVGQTDMRTHSGALLIGFHIYHLGTLYTAVNLYRTLFENLDHFACDSDELWVKVS